MRISKERDTRGMVSHLEKREDPNEHVLHNTRLNTPTLKRLSMVNDGNSILKQEIAESFLRVKAAKHGSRLAEIMPSHKIDFFAPEKIRYFKPPDPPANLRQQRSESLNENVARSKIVSFAGRSHNSKTIIQGDASITEDAGMTNARSGKMSLRSALVNNHEKRSKTQNKTLEEHETSKLMKKNK